MDKLRNDETNELFKAILKLQSVEECYNFFEDLCTVTELLSMGQRLRVAKMLKENRVYTDIAEKTGASTATISRVNRALQYGNGGYDAILSRLEEE